MQSRYWNEGSGSQSLLAAVCTLSLPVSSADGVAAAECTLNSCNRLASSSINFYCVTVLRFCIYQLGNGWIVIVAAGQSRRRIDGLIAIGDLE